MLLAIRRGKAKNKTRVVTRPVFIVGGNRDCDMVLGDPQFAPMHFYLFHRNGATTLRCLSGFPEVTINGKRKRAASIHDGDRIRTGCYEFVFKAA